MGAPLNLTWGSFGSLLATAVVVRNVLPPEAHTFLRSLLSRAAAAFFSPPPRDAIIINEADSNGVPNELFDAAQLYLGARCLSTAPALLLHKPHGSDADSTSVVASLPDSHATHDTFRGVRLLWTSDHHDAILSSVVAPLQRGGLARHHHQHHQQRRFLRLEFRRCDRDVVLDAYIPYVLETAAAMRARTRERKLYTNNAGFYGGGGGAMADEHQMLWKPHAFSHPSTLDTLAVDPSLRDAIRVDLLRFVRRRDRYARAGRAWKRGYLLHGPPGTGKTSLVAAIANLLEFDIYDLELTAVNSNHELRRLLASTRPKSVIVVEDVDCSLGLFDRTRSPRSHENSSAMMLQRETISLSGVLNFVDGLWSSCVGERLVVFTTNHIDRLDPALLRPGRMDRKIELGYCKAPALRVLAKNYLAGDGDEDGDDAVADEEEELMGEAASLLEEVEVTPADVAEVFMGCDGDEGAHFALRKLVEELNRRRVGHGPV
uniref:AAA+ ATPase domain-containing protein n=1 Tax=Leersia perrieri TaxID=77586 RepID=A0A0D9WTN4_9ORYZ